MAKNNSIFVKILRSHSSLEKKKGKIKEAVSIKTNYNENKKVGIEQVCATCSYRTGSAASQPPAPHKRQVLQNKYNKTIHTVTLLILSTP